MHLDHAGAMLIGSALVMLFSRTVLALLRQRAVHEARTQHYTADAKAWSVPGASLLQHVPPRLKIGLAMGAAGALVPFAMRHLSRIMLGGDADGDGPLGKALFVAGKWLVLGGILTTVRKWGVGQLQRARA